GAKVPELRFAGFADDWEVRKLGSLTTVVRGASPRPIQDPKWFDKESDIGWLRIADVTEQNGRIYHLEQHISKLGQEKTRVLTEPHLLLSIAATVGKPVVNYVKTGVHDGFLIFLNPTFEREFMFQWLEMFRPKWQKYGQPGSQVNLNSELVRNQEIVLPNYKEQQKIGSFFKQLDNTITLHQRKLDLLKEQKKGYLQKMFPKNGAKVPELRFAGFADDWEQRKLSDVANHRGGTAIEKYFDKDGVYKVISIGSYGLNSQYVDQNIRAISNEITDGRVVNSGELTMVLNDKTANGTIIGRTLLVEKDNEYVINQRTEIISPKENFDSSFAYTILNGPFREKVKRIVQGGTQIYVNYPAVSNLNLELPKIEEQQKIGSFFKQLDDTIALHQRKLDLLKEQKKGFLQKMFV
ncbi:MAG: restriction endonuclease subunit S, partial [Lactococcus cremoris]